MRILPFLLSLLLLVSCADGFTDFPVKEKDQQKVSADLTIVRLSEGNISSFAGPPKLPERTSLQANTNWEYKVGVGDILSVIVFEQPELTIQSGGVAAAETSGYTVQADGTFFFPYVGAVKAKGLSIQDIRNDVALRLAEYFPEPQVEVRISRFNSQSVNVAGEVKTPNRQALNTVPLTLLEAISAAGGFTEAADQTRVSLQRGGEVYRVDVAAFLTEGYSANNPVMRNGDIVTVPRRQVEEAYLLGEVLRPATVDLSLDSVTLTQALTRQGGVEGIRADARGIFVFRNINSRMVVFQLDAESPVALLLGTRFPLVAGDVIYVTRSPLQRWNDTISRLLPSVQATALTQSLVD